jgi:hypothetical protein
MAGGAGGSTDLQQAVAIEQQKLQFMSQVRVTHLSPLSGFQMSQDVKKTIFTGLPYFIEFLYTKKMHFIFQNRLNSCSVYGIF